MPQYFPITPGGRIGVAITPGRTSATRHSFSDRLDQEVAVARLDREREACVGLGVFMAAADPGLRRQGGEARQRGVHLRRGAFEQAPAAEAEQGVAAEQQALAASL